MDKEVDDIIHDCIRPNFVELPQVFEELPTPANRGQYDTQDTDVEDEILSAEEENTSQDTENGNEVK